MQVLLIEIYRDSVKFMSYIFFTFLVMYNSRYIFFYYKMAVVLKGEQQTDGSFAFKASSEQVNSLNKMCDGNLDTQLSDVQFGMTNTGVVPATHV